MTKVRSPS